MTREAGSFHVIEKGNTRGKEIDKRREAELRRKAEKEGDSGLEWLFSALLSPLLSSAFLMPCCRVDPHPIAIHGSVSGSLAGSATGAFST